MKERFFYLLTLLVLIMLFAGCSSSEPAEPIEIDIPAVSPEPEPEPMPDPEDGRIQIVDNRDDKIPLTGKYLHEKTPEKYFEIFDDYAVIVGTPSYHFQSLLDDPDVVIGAWQESPNWFYSTRIDMSDIEGTTVYETLEINYQEGVTWLSFRPKEASKRSVQFMSVDLKTFVNEEADYLDWTGSTSIFDFSEYHKVDSEPSSLIVLDNPVPENLLDVDSKMLSKFWGKTYGELEKLYGPFEYVGQTQSVQEKDKIWIHDLDAFYSEKLPGILEFYVFELYIYDSAKEDYVINNDAELAAIGMDAKSIFPNMAPFRIFVEEIEAITGEKVIIDRDRYFHWKAYFIYRDYEFWYFPNDTYDLAYDMFVMVKQKDRQLVMPD